MPIAAALPYIALAVSGIGVLSSASNQVQAGKAQKDAYEYNAAIAEQDAKALEGKAAYEEKLQREKYARILGSQRAGYAASGVDISSGSPLDILKDQAYQAERDALNVRWSGLSEATRKRNEAAIGGWSGSQAVKTANAAALSTIFQGAGNIGTAYYGGKIRKWTPGDENTEVTKGSGTGPV